MYYSNICHTYKDIEEAYGQVSQLEVMLLFRGKAMIPILKLSVFTSTSHYFKELSHVSCYIF